MNGDRIALGKFDMDYGFEMSERNENKMKIKPVTNAVEPGYPNKYEIDLNRVLLYHRPKRWLKDSFIGVTCTALLVTSLSSCGSNPTLDSPPETSQVPVLNKNISANAKDVPLFEYGEGTGYIGGEGASISSSGFISEKDAYDIISTELENAGFTCEKDGDKVEEASIPVTYPYGSESFGDEKFEKKTVVSGEFDFDAQTIVNNECKINIEFVSEEDYMAWIDPDVTWESTLTQYDIKETAEGLKTLYKNAAVFYDPMDGSDEGIPTEELEGMTQEQQDEYFYEKMTEKSREKLRLQVIDFIEWLKSIDAVQ